MTILRHVIVVQLHYYGKAIRSSLVPRLQSPVSMRESDLAPWPAAEWRRAPGGRPRLLTFRTTRRVDRCLSLHYRNMDGKDVRAVNKLCKCSLNSPGRGKAGIVVRLTRVWGGVLCNCFYNPAPNSVLVITPRTPPSGPETTYHSGPQTTSTTA